MHVCVCECMRVLQYVPGTFLQIEEAFEILEGLTAYIDLDPYYISVLYSSSRIRTKGLTRGNASNIYISLTTLLSLMNYVRSTGNLVKARQMSHPTYCPSARAPHKYCLQGS